MTLSLIIFNLKPLTKSSDHSDCGLWFFWEGLWRPEEPTVVAADNCGWPRASWTLGLHPAVGEEVRVTPEYATLPVLLGLWPLFRRRGETNSFVCWCIMCMFVYGSVLIGFGLLLFPVNVFHELIKIKSINQSRAEWLLWVIVLNGATKWCCLKSNYNNLIT